MGKFKVQWTTDNIIHEKYIELNQIQEDQIIIFPNSPQKFTSDTDANKNNSSLTPEQQAEKALLLSYRNKTPQNWDYQPNLFDLCSPDAHPKKKTPELTEFMIWYWNMGTYLFEGLTSVNYIHPTNPKSVNDVPIKKAIQKLISEGKKPETY